MMSESSEIPNTIIQLTQQLLDAINGCDFVTYSQLVDPNVTSFEPEAVGNLVTGLEFHKFYFENNCTLNTFAQGFS